MTNAAVPRSLASLARLMSAESFRRLRAAHVGVLGVGGVGSWAAEALGRSGVGRLTLVDLDHVAEGNLNRQVQALNSTLGQAKIEALATRLRDIRPDLPLDLIDDFLTPDNAEGVLSSGPEVWIDATDDMPAKVAVATHCLRTARLRLVICGAAGGKTDPSSIRVADLVATQHDRLLAALRSQLRGGAALPQQPERGRTPNTGLLAVYSNQPAARLQDLDAGPSACDPSARLACAGYGSSVMVTGSMGFMAAYAAMHLATDDTIGPP